MVKRTSVFVLLLLPACVAAQERAVAEDGGGKAILERVAEAARKNREPAERFLFREDIVRLSHKESGDRIIGRRTFEVSFLEGENYYRLIGENGEPLQIDEEMAEQQRFLKVAEYRKKTPLAERRKQAAKEERNRLKFDLELLAATHTARVVGAEAVGGRATTVAEIAPSGRLRKPKNRNQWGQILAGRLWVDDETGYPVRAELRQLVEWDLQPAGNRTVFEWIRIEGTWLIGSIENSEPMVGGGMLITRQNYSHYSRFQAESKLILTETP